MGDNKKFYQMLYRITSAAFRRAVSGDPDELVDLGNFVGFVRSLEFDAVQTWRAQGYSWEHIGSAFGLSRQAAFNRWGRKGIDLSACLRSRTKPPEGGEEGRARRRTPKSNRG